MQQNKTIKDCAKEAKKRMKSGFWQNYKKNMENVCDKADADGIQRSKITEYYNDRVKENIVSSDSTSDDFYFKVKSILDQYGEVPDIIKRLIDEKDYNALSYEEKQRYMLVLSDKYLKALERYNKEKELKVSF